jgi:hypothetical protein
MVIWHILWSFGIFYGSFGIFYGHFGIFFPVFGMLYREKSGNPGQALLTMETVFE